ncbi:MAG TPA: tRNA (adenosine(37)-N6)-dimethylallyltransferase MiaA [Phycisphaerae bacterium]|nr:tRNA (adenosine(37)-N6)-dimethylallyltransferase MiaA [Phycisphaerae bacterium]
MAPPIPILVITGQTATGKERLAVAVAERLGGEILSADSMKVYRGMDIGTAKAPPDVRRKVPHHLVDVADPGPGSASRQATARLPCQGAKPGFAEATPGAPAPLGLGPGFSTARWVELADAAIADVTARGRAAIVSGGTALYLKALLEGLFEGPAADEQVRARLSAEAEANGADVLHRRLAQVDPEAAGRIHPNDLRRIIRALEVWELTGSPISSLQTQWGHRRGRCRALLVAIRRSPEDLGRRIEERVRRMVEAGLLEEVRRLAARPGGLALGPRQALGYAEVLEHLAGRITWDETLEAIRLHTRQFARAQMKWLRRFEGLVWLDAAPDAPPDGLADRVETLWRQHVVAHE